MARITGVESITVSSELLPELTAEVQPGERLTVVVDYGDHYRTSIAMDDLLKPLSEALSGLLSATATLEGWQQLIASLSESGNAAWKSAVAGKAERLESAMCIWTTRAAPAPSGCSVAPTCMACYSLSSTPHRPSAQAWVCSPLPIGQ